jgi:hypothetical protein
MFEEYNITMTHTIAQLRMPCCPDFFNSIRTAFDHNLYNVTSDPRIHTYVVVFSASTSVLACAASCCIYLHSARSAFCCSA